MPDTSNLLSQFYLKIGGDDAPAPLVADLLEVTVESSLHLPDVATLIFHDARLRWIDDATLALGKPIEVWAKAGRQKAPLFDGEIVEIESEFKPETQRLVVRAFDRLHRLARGRRVRSFQNMTDEELVRKLAQECSLQAEVAPMPQVYSYVLQANQTNLAFLQERAAARGYLLFVRGKKLHCEPLKSNGQPIELQWGDSLSEFHPRMTTIGQVNRVVARGWDPLTRQEIVREVQEGIGAPELDDERSGGEVAKEAFRIDSLDLVADRPIRTNDAAEHLAKAVASRHAGQFVEAEGTCGGNPAIVAGVSVRLNAVGKRFGGTYFVTGASHRYNADQGYTTGFSISGLNPATLISLLAPPHEDRAAGGLVIGIVTDNQDPDGMGRVKVKYPWLSSDHASDWMRVVAVGGGKGRGVEFLPEINDEVLIGFELGDIHHPYVLGGLWNGVDEPPGRKDAVVRDGKVQQRIIKSRAGHTITIDDSDDGGGVTIEDKNGNKIQLDSGANALMIEVKGNATLKAQGSLRLEAKGNVDIQGTMINLNS